MEFVAKSKKLTVKVAGESYEMRFPTIGQTEVLQEKINKGEPKDAIKVYKKFFEELGLPSEAIDQFDHDDFLNFVEFVLSPKKKD